MQPKPESILGEPFWSLDEIIALATYKQFGEDDHDKQSQEVYEFKATLLGDLKEAILCRKIAPVDLVKNAHWADRYKEYLNPIRNSMILLLMTGLGYLLQQYIMSHPESYYVLFKPGQNPTNFVQGVLFNYVLVISIACLIISLIFLCYMALKKYSSKTPKGKFEFQMEDAEHRGFCDNLYISDGVIDLLNEKYFLKIPKDPFRVWKMPFFRRNGDCWIIGYEGKAFILQEKTVHSQLAYLLSNPYKQFHCLELENVHPDAIGNKAFTNQEWDKEEKEYETIKNKARSLKLSKSNILGLIQKLLADKEQALCEGKENLALEKDSQIVNLKRYAKGAFTKTGAEKNVNDMVEKAKENVNQHFKRFYRSLEKESPELVLHLRKNINLGYNPIYRPPEEIHWDVQF